MGCNVKRGKTGGYPVARLTRRGWPPRRMAPVICCALVLLLVGLRPVAPSYGGGVEQLNLGEFLGPGSIAQGGTITDGRDLRYIRWGRHPEFERVVLDIYHGRYEEKGPEADEPCFFAIELEEYPSRIVIQLAGIRAVHADFEVDFGESRLVRNTHRLPIFDDSGALVVIVLEDYAEFRAFGLSDPGRIVVDIRKRCPMQEAMMYSLRSGALEGYDLEGPYYQLKDAGVSLPRYLQNVRGALVLEAGLFGTRGEAEETLTELEERTNMPLFIEKRGPLDLPE